MIFPWSIVVVFSVITLTSGLNHLNMQLLQRLGLTPNSQHEAKSARGPLLARKYRPNSSPIYTIQLPPSPFFYHLHNHLSPPQSTDQLFPQQRQEITPDPDQMHVVPMKFAGNGRPHSVYHYSTPMIFSKKALVTPLKKYARFRKRTSKLDSQTALSQKLSPQHAEHANWSSLNKPHLARRSHAKMGMNSERQNQQHRGVFSERTIINVKPFKQQRYKTKLHVKPKKQMKGAKATKGGRKRTRKVSDPILHYNYLGNGRPARVYLLETSRKTT